MVLRIARYNAVSIGLVLTLRYVSVRTFVKVFHKLEKLTDSINKTVRTQILDERTGLIRKIIMNLRKDEALYKDATRKTTWDRSTFYYMNLTLSIRLSIKFLCSCILLFCLQLERFERFSWNSLHWLIRLRPPST